MVRIFQRKLKGEVLDEYAQQTPGIARQLRVNSTQNTALPTDAVSKLSIGPSSTWGDEVVPDTKKVDFGNGRAGSKGEQLREGEGEEGGTGCKAMHENGEKREQHEEVTKKPLKKEKQKKQGKVVDRRRQRRRPGREPTPQSSEDEGDDESEQSDLSSGSSSISGSSEEKEDEERIDMIDSLSETSSSEGEGEVGGGGVTVAPNSVSPQPWTSSILRIGQTTDEDTGCVAGETEESGGKGGEGGGGRGGEGEGGGGRGGRGGRGGVGGGGRGGGGGGRGGGERGGAGGGAGGGGGVGGGGAGGGVGGGGGGRGGGGGKRQIVLAANFGAQTVGSTASGGDERWGREGVATSVADDRLFQVCVCFTLQR